MATTQRPWQFWLLFPLLLIMTKYSYALESLADADMRDITGQSLFTANYINGTGTAATGTAGVDFYRLGLDAEMSLNMNVKSIKLGCNGVNGPACDIDIDDVSLSGTEACITANGRPNCDAVVTRPFLEFAIKNPNSLATREILGFRFGAQSLSGLLTAGTNDGTANGLNRFSGYMAIAATTGTTTTQAANFTNVLEGNTTVGGCTSGCPSPFFTNTAPLAVPSLGVNFNVGAFTVEGNQLESTSILATTTAPDIIFNAASGTRTATVPGCIYVIGIGLCGTVLNSVQFDTRLTNLKINIGITEDLGFLHKIPLNNPFGLSVQKESVWWPGAPAAARRGWYLAINDPVQLGSLSTPGGFAVDITSVFPQVATKASDYLYANPVNVPFGSAIGGVLGITITLTVPPIDLSAATPANLALSNLPLGTAQDVTPNCWGTLKFC